MPCCRSGVDHTADDSSSRGSSSREFEAAGRIANGRRSLDATRDVSTPAAAISSCTSPARRVPLRRNTMSHPIPQASQAFTWTVSLYAATDCQLCFIRLTSLRNPSGVLCMAKTQLGCKGENQQRKGRLGLGARSIAGKCISCLWVQVVQHIHSRPGKPAPGRTYFALRETIT